MENCAVSAVFGLIRSQLDCFEECNHTTDIFYKENTLKSLGTLRQFMATPYCANQQFWYWYRTRECNPLIFLNCRMKDR